LSAYHLVLSNEAKIPSRKLDNPASRGLAIGGASVAARPLSLSHRLVAGGYAGPRARPVPRGSAKGGGPLLEALPFSSFE
jgi:hypothetical protein